MLAAALLALLAPVPGDVARPYSFGAAPFAAGQHRGVDLSASPGARVRAACSGRVTHAGPTPSGLAVTIRCGDHAVTQLPLARIAVRRGKHVPAGTLLGTVGTGSGHAGLHLGVRRADEEHGYVDPAPLIARQAPPPIGPPPLVTRPLPPRPLRSPPLTARRPLQPRLAHDPPVTAPWTAWIGLALAAAALGGTVPTIRARRRRRCGALQPDAAA